MFIEGDFEMKKFSSVEGRVIGIEMMKTTVNDESGCTMMMSIETRDGDNFNLVVGIDTYFVDHVNIRVGHNIIAFYNALAPTPMIFPPQFRAIVIARMSKKQIVKVDNFNDELISSDESLRLNIGHKTHILLQNGQTFLGEIKGRDLVVVYSASTKSIPAITTPSEIIVLCDNLDCV